MAFVCKQTAVLVLTSITLDNNKAVLRLLDVFLTAYFTTCLTRFFSFEYFDPFDHFAAFLFPLKTIVPSLINIYQNISITIRSPSKI